jgi:small subunit ribosomal protein S2
MTETTLQQLLEAGCHFGHQTRRWNPIMRSYIYGERDGVHIFDLVKTKAGLDQAMEVVGKMAAEGKVILFVGTKRQAQDAVKKAAIEAGMPYLIQRWPGGFLTNFEQIRKTVSRMLDFKDKKARGELKKYTKREQLLIDRDVAQMEKSFGGVVNMTKLPDALFVVDTHLEDVAVHEANRVNIPVIGMVDTNGNPTIVDYVIPSNDDAVKAIELVVDQIAAAIKDRKPAAAKVPEAAQPAILRA